MAEGVFFVERAVVLSSDVSSVPSVRRMRVKVDRSNGSSVEEFKRQIITGATGIGAQPSDQLEYWELEISEWVEIFSLDDLPEWKGKLRLVAIVPAVTELLAKADTPLAPTAELSPLPQPQVNVADHSQATTEMDVDPVGSEATPATQATASPVPTKATLPDTATADAMQLDPPLNDPAKISSIAPEVVNDLLRHAFAELVRVAQPPSDMEMPRFLLNESLDLWIARLRDWVMELVHALPLPDKNIIVEAQRILQLKHDVLPEDLCQRLMRMCEEVVSKTPSLRLSFVAQLAEGKTMADLQKVLAFAFRTLQLAFRHVSVHECLIMCLDETQYAEFLSAWRNHPSPGVKSTMAFLSPYFPSPKMILGCPTDDVTWDEKTQQDLREAALVLWKVQMEKVMRMDGMLRCICEPCEELKGQKECPILGKSFAIQWEQHLVISNRSAEWTASDIEKGVQLFASSFECPPVTVVEASPCMCDWLLVTIHTDILLERISLVPMGSGVLSTVFSSQAPAFPDPSPSCSHRMTLYLAFIRDSVMRIQCESFRHTLMDSTDEAVASCTIERVTRETRTLFNSLQLYPKEEVPTDQAIAAPLGQVITEFKFQALKTLCSTFTDFLNHYLQPAVVDSESFRGLEISSIRGECLEKAAAVLSIPGVPILKISALITDEKEVSDQLQDCLRWYGNAALEIPPLLREPIERVEAELLGLVSELKELAKDVAWKSVCGLVETFFGQRWKADLYEQLREVHYDEALLPKAFECLADDMVSLREVLANHNHGLSAFAEEAAHRLKTLANELHRNCLVTLKSIVKIAWQPGAPESTVDDVRNQWQALTGLTVVTVEHPSEPHFQVVLSSQNDLDSAFAKFANAQKQEARMGRQLFLKCHVVMPLQVRLSPFPESLKLRTDLQLLIVEALDALNIPWFDVTVPLEGDPVVLVRDIDAMARLPKEVSLHGLSIPFDIPADIILRFPETATWSLTQAQHDLSNGPYGSHVRGLYPWFANEVLLLMNSHVQIPKRIRLCGVDVYPVPRNLYGTTRAHVWDAEYYAHLSAEHDDVGNFGESRLEYQMMWDADAWKTAAENWSDEPLLQSVEASASRRHRLNVCVMLSTIGACRQGNVVSEDGVEHELSVVPGVQKSERRAARAIAPDSEPPFPYTIVSVVDQDTIAASLAAKKEDRRVLALDFANAHHPGGGYLRGKIAQEEDLFRRSNLAFALDSTFTKGSSIYPIGEFDSVIVKDATVFRGPSCEGYPFIKPEQIDFLVAAAYNANGKEDFSVTQPASPASAEPKSPSTTTTSANGGFSRSSQPLPDPDQVFTPDGFSRTFRKIHDGIFATALQQRYDVLVLGAFGCGAFANPPHEVAGIFKELIRFYAGHFQEVIFAIPSGGKNFKTFCHVLTPHALATENRECVKPPRFHHWQPFEFDSFVCRDLSLCIQQDDKEHSGKYWHPKPCPYPDRPCPFLHESVHKRLFRHENTKCPKAGECERYHSSDRELRKNHQKWFRHPPQCSNPSCEKTDPKHLREYLHLPFCEKGNRCEKIGDQDHPFRHTQPRCTFEAQCAKFGDHDHLLKFLHPFRPPCQHPISCSECEKESHTRDFSHVCPHGSHCKDKSPSHARSWIHIGHHDCPDGHKCELKGGILGEIHLSTFSHPGIPDIRPACRYGTACREFGDSDHIKKYSHPLPKLPSSRVYGHNTMTGLYGDKSTSRRTTFFHNRQELEKRLDEHFKKIKSEPRSSVVKDVCSWIKNFRVVHRCSPATFAKMWKTGSLMSLLYLQTQLSDFASCAKLAVQHHLIHKMEDKYPNCVGLIHTFCEDVTRLVFNQKASAAYPPAPAPAPAFAGLALGPAVGIGMGAAALGVAAGAAASLKGQIESDIKKSRSFLVNYMDKHEVQAIYDTVQEFVVGLFDLAVALARKEVGIGHAPDEKFETNKMVFGIFGPHGFNYGGDPMNGVHIIFRPEIIFHPDFFVTPMAATFYASHHADKQRYWGPKTTHPFEAFFREKLHPLDHGFYEVLALEYIARVASVLKLKPHEVTLTHVKNWWLGEDAHYVSEAHLPYTVPFGFVESVVMHQTNYDKLTPEMQKQMKDLLGERNLHLVTGTPKDVDAKAFELAQARVPYHRPPCLAFTLFKNTIDVELPVRVQGPEGAWIYFRADALPFYLTLHKEDARRKEGSNDLLTIYFSEERSYITRFPPQVKPPPNTLVESVYLNHCCRPSLGYFYAIRINPHKNQLVVKHSGPSLIYCRAKMILKDKVDGICRVSFSTGDQPVQFDEVRVILNKKYKLKSPLQKVIHQSREKQDGDPKKTSSASPQRSSSKGKGRAKNEKDSDEDKPSFLNKAINCIKAFVGLGKSDVRIPLCRDGLHCILCYQKPAEDKERMEHCKKYAHLCLYGQGCSDEDADHSKHFIHMDKKKCDGRGCELDDIAHRAKYHHEGYWDLLLPCRDGRSCRKIRDAKHCERYTHQNVRYQLDEDGKLKWEFARHKNSDDDKSGESDHEDNNERSYRKSDHHRHTREKSPSHRHKGRHGSETRHRHSSPGPSSSSSRRYNAGRERGYRSGRAIVDVAFSFDTTGSMSSYLIEVRKTLKSTLAELYEKLADKCSLRVCIVAHGDYCDAKSTYVIKDSGFSNDVGELQGFVDKCGNTGGGDEPECYELVCYQANREFKWRSDASTKVLVIIGDAPPHEKGYSGFCAPAPYEGIDWRTEVRSLAEKNVIIYTVKCGESGGPFWDEAPRMTKGKALPLSDAKKMPTLFGAIIAKCGDTDVYEEYKRATRSSGLEAIYGIMDSK